VKISHFFDTPFWHGSLDMCLTFLCSIKIDAIFFTLLSRLNVPLYNMTMIVGNPLSTNQADRRDKTNFQLRVSRRFICFCSACALELDLKNCSGICLRYNLLDTSKEALLQLLPVNRDVFTHPVAPVCVSSVVILKIATYL
jgi:hypothetical protein